MDNTCINRKQFLFEISALPDCLMSSDGDDYTGYTSITESGKTCQEWVAQSPHTHGFGTLLSGEVNYCRNPDGKSRPWCFTMDSNTEWEYCSISNCCKCRGGGSWVGGSWLVVGLFVSIILQIVRAGIFMFKVAPNKCKLETRQRSSFRYSFL